MIMQDTCRCNIRVWQLSDIAFVGWGVLAGLPGSIDGFGGLVWDLHANSGDIFARAACATARLGEF